MLPTAARFKYLYLAYLSKPSNDRALYRMIRKHKVRKILELGMGKGLRARRMIELAMQVKFDKPVWYTAVDLFEMRPAEVLPGVALKLAHRDLQTTGAKVRLLPGDPFSTLSRAANTIGPQDLIVISADQDRESLARAWFYMPRMLHDQSRLFVEESEGDGRCALRLMPRAEIEQLAADTRRRAA